jgi:hypothetical protein
MNVTPASSGLNRFFSKGRIWAWRVAKGVGAFAALGYVGSHLMLHKNADMEGPSLSSRTAVYTPVRAQDIGKLQQILPDISEGDGIRFVDDNPTRCHWAGLIANGSPLTDPAYQASKLAVNVYSKDGKDFVQIYQYGWRGYVPVMYNYLNRYPYMKEIAQSVQTYQSDSATGEMTVKRKAVLLGDEPGSDRSERIISTDQFIIPADGAVSGEIGLQASEAREIVKACAAARAKALPSP